MEKRYELWEVTADPKNHENGTCLWDGGTQFDGTAEELQAEYDAEKARLELENPDKVYTLVVEECEYEYDEPDPEERFWAAQVTYAERHSDHGSDY